MAKARVLAVDDQRYFRELIEGLLSEEGYEVHTVSSGEEALHVLEREDFDVIITDLVMPGIDGAQLVERVKERVPDQDIVMVTGVVDVKTAVEAMKLGATDYILKPFDRKALMHSLGGILQRRRLREEHARLMEENLEYMGVLSLYERAAGLFSTLGLGPLAERLVEGLCLETSAQGGVVWVADEADAQRLQLLAARGIIRMDEEPEELAPAELGERFAPLLDQGRSMVAPRREGRGEGAALYVPLRSGNSLLGIARLSDKLEGDDFDDRDRASAEKFAALGAIAIANAIRFRSLERRSFRDPTTKAYTAAYFHDVVRNEIQKANRFGRQFSLLRFRIGALAAMRARVSENQVARWLESLVEHVGRALRSTDLLAAHNDSSFSVLLPEADSVGAALLKQRIQAAAAEVEPPQGLPSEIGAELAVASATFPTDGTQLEALDRALDVRLDTHRESLVHELLAGEADFARSLARLLSESEPQSEVDPAQVVRLLLDEVTRRPQERGLLFVSPGDELVDVVRDGLERMGRSGLAGCRTEVVVLGDTARPEAGDAAQLPATWIGADRVPCAAPFLLYYGDGPAYACIGSHKPDASGGDQGFFHTSDRALVEHLAFQLQRELGIQVVE